MIIIKLADGSFAKISDTDFNSLERNGIVNIKSRLKTKKSIKDRILSLKELKSGITIGRLLNRYRSSGSIVGIIDELEKEGKIKSVYSVKEHDTREVRTIFKINENK